MLKKENLRIFIAGGKTLEFKEMHKFLIKQKYPFREVDLFSPEFAEELSALPDDVTIVLAGWDLTVRRNGVAKVGFGKNGVSIVLPRQTAVLNAALHNCLYRQLLRFLMVAPTAYQKKIIANAEGGIEGLYKLNLKKNEIEEIRNKEFRLLGLSKKDQNKLEADFAKAEIKNGLYEIEVAKPAYFPFIFDEAFKLSFGRPRKLDIFVCFRDGSQSFYYGRSEIAYSLFEKFQGLYDGNNDWTGYKETVEEARDFLHSLYSK